MTSSLQPAVESLGYNNVKFTYWTCPAVDGGIHSINSPADSKKSAEICITYLKPVVPFHDCFLVACYSRHPLVQLLREECEMETTQTTKGAGGRGTAKYVIGILEASVSMALGLIGAGLGKGRGQLKPEGRFERESFGIVSTATVWEVELSDAVEDMLGTSSSGTTAPSPFAACTTTGLNGNELHELDPEAVQAKMKEATRKLVKVAEGDKKDVRAVCLGCAGMAGLEESVREACVEEMGETRGRTVHVVDGVKAGVSILVGMARGGL